MTAVSDIISAIGRTKLREKLGVTDSAISNALARSVFPPKWYRIVKEECEEVDAECPLDLFGFMGPVDHPDAGEDAA